MKDIYPSVEQKTIELASRFGFVSRQTFAEFISPTARSTQFKHWSKLLSKGLLESYPTIPGIFVLTVKGRRTSASKPVSVRAVHYIEHDDLVAKALLVFQNSGLVSRYWSERDLKSDAILAADIMGMPSCSKFPDLVIELSNQHSAIRVAVEIERSGKCQSRYLQMALSYGAAQAIHLVFFGCRSESNERVILRSLQARGDAALQKFPATFLIDDLKSNRGQATVKYRGVSASLIDFLRAALGAGGEQWGNHEKHRDCMQTESLHGVSID